VRQLARKHTAAAIKKLAEILETGQSEQAQILAATALLDRGWGKPTQPISGDDDMPPVKIDARAVLSDAIARVASAAETGGGNSEPLAGAIQRIVVTDDRRMVADELIERPRKTL
jgi:hypothetical protein